MKTSVKIPLTYLFASALWIAGSDAMLGYFFPLWSALGLYKDWLFAIAGASLLFALLRREASKRDAVEDGLRRLAMYDPLTGLLNRSSFAENLELAVARAAREDRKVGVVFVDLDGFKGINDAHGHHVGDHLLKEVARRIRRVVRSDDHAGRFGGDEFVILFHGDREESGKRVTERLMEALRAPLWIDGRLLAVTASVGYAMYPDHGTMGEHLLRAADLAMYRGKQLGKNAAIEARPYAA